MCLGVGVSVRFIVEVYWLWDQSCVRSESGDGGGDAYLSTTPG